MFSVEKCYIPRTWLNNFRTTTSYFQSKLGAKITKIDDNLIPAMAAKIAAARTSKPNQLFTRNMLAIDF